jgi:hypothetical protein
MTSARYLVIWKDDSSRENGVFYTQYFDPEKFNPSIDMVVVDRMRDKVSFDGYTWQTIDEDHL